MIRRVSLSFVYCTVGPQAPRLSVSSAPPFLPFHLTSPHATDSIRNRLLLLVPAGSRGLHRRRPGVARPLPSAATPWFTGAMTPGAWGSCGRSARSAGGKVIGVSPRLFVDKGVIDNACDELIITEDMCNARRSWSSRAMHLSPCPGASARSRNCSRCWWASSQLPQQADRGAEHRRLLQPVCGTSWSMAVSPGFVRQGTLEQMCIASSATEAIEHIRHYSPGAGVNILLDARKRPAAGWRADQLRGSGPRSRTSHGRCPPSTPRDPSAFGR